ncbi:MAG: hypothetical protein A2W31_14795 [Planctomycetes bacterium RBG_16_64_10]|nr:MAG: hypothetical protein A2W31_14795 [Planctomycetes bacterium RBG_16_64_10]
MTAGGANQVVVLTAAGRSAVASLLVDGPQARELIAARFKPLSGRPFDGYPLRAVVVGRWGGPRGEEVVVCPRADDRIEVHCHGGLAAVSALVNDLVQLGCRQLPWTAWLRLRECDPIRAAARRSLADSRTLLTAAILLDQYAGALHRGFHQIEWAILDGKLGQATATAEEMLGRAALGRHLVEPWRVVLAGRPNTGKSSLLNALLGYRRAIVNEQPGTTRDVVTARTALGGWPVELADTAGLTASCDPLEAAGVARTQEQLRTADAVVLVLDASRPVRPEETQLEVALPRAIRVHNKWDLAAPRVPDSAALCVSALTGAGVDRLAAAIAIHLVPDPPPSGAAVPFRPAHVRVLAAVRSALSQQDGVAALELLRRLIAPRTGSTPSAAAGHRSLV